MSECFVDMATIEESSDDDDDNEYIAAADVHFNDGMLMKHAL